MTPCHLTTRCNGRTRVSRRLLKVATGAPRGAPLNAGVRRQELT
jgi:hypothetical protein